MNSPPTSTKSDDDREPCTGGHDFAKTNISKHKQPYCHHCCKLLWPSHGHACKSCNFTSHKHCVRNITSPCQTTSVTRVAHLWSESSDGHQKKRFCNVCRLKKPTCHCETCDYRVHAQCQPSAVPNCRQAASDTAGGRLENSRRAAHHHWREGNLKAGASCSVCRRSCYSGRCLSGWQCDWCGTTVHSKCLSSTTGSGCSSGGILASCTLPPDAVRAHATALETIIRSTRTEAGESTTDNDDQSEHLSLYVGNLPANLSRQQYERILADILGEEIEPQSISAIYYRHGALVITFNSGRMAADACRTLQGTIIEEKAAQVVLLPNIVAESIPADARPMLVMVNVDAGGRQGLKLVSKLRKLLNPYQVYDLSVAGPLAGLHAFRNVKNCRILVCGGDGTVSWVLQCADDVAIDNPEFAVLPLGTGNDLARTLRWGPGYNGGSLLRLLERVTHAEPVNLDRWTVECRHDQSDQDKKTLVMNNYFGIGIDADVCLKFHTARLKNPDKFTSRLHNKLTYAIIGFKKSMAIQRKTIARKIRLQVDGKVIVLPPLEGIIILNISSWASGANPWGADDLHRFSKADHCDGLLEVVGVTDIVHLSQIQAGIKPAVRIAQGEDIRILLKCKLPVHVDGEPWSQCAGQIVLSNSAPRATMLKKKTKEKKTNEKNEKETKEAETK